MLPTTPDAILYGLDLFGTAVFAVTGALAAGRRKMDLFGLLILAAVTAVGGGTIRDLLLDRHPVFWIADVNYLITIGAAGVGTFGYLSFFRPPERLLEVADAFGLAVFTVVGAQVGLGAEVTLPVVVLMCMITGTVGGMVRDVLCGQPPLILRREIYATATLVGGCLYLALRAASLSEAIVSAVTIAVVFAIRLAALYWEVNLPSFSVRKTSG